ncbi:MAG: DUF1918 domain-containing protein, partial [Actinomycetota bacterium]|nr:DUF1918 domain-containing protein [Actinomycetota bacterium]
PWHPVPTPRRRRRGGAAHIEGGGQLMKAQVGDRPRFYSRHLDHTDRIATVCGSAPPARRPTCRGSPTAPSS